MANLFSGMRGAKNAPSSSGQFDPTLSFRMHYVRKDISPQRNKILCDQTACISLGPVLNVLKQINKIYNSLLFIYRDVQLSALVIPLTPLRPWSSVP